MSNLMSEAELILKIEQFRWLLRGAIKTAIQRNPKLRRWVQEPDIRQEVLLRLLKAVRVTEIHSDAHFIHLLLLQLRRTIIDFHRNIYGPNGWAINLKSDPDAIQKDKLTLENRLVDRFSSGEPITVEEWIDFHLSIEKLSEDEQKVFQMMFYGQLTDLKVAELLGCSDRTVRRLWRNARLKLQQMINEKRSS